MVSPDGRHSKLPHRVSMRCQRLKGRHAVPHPDKKSVCAVKFRYLSGTVVPIPCCGLLDLRTSAQGLRFGGGGGVAQRLRCQVPRPRQRHRNRVPQPMACRQHQHKPDRHKRAHDRQFRHSDRPQQRRRTGLAQPPRHSGRRRHPRRYRPCGRCRHWDLESSFYAPWAARRGAAIRTLCVAGAPRTSRGGAAARTGHSSPTECLQWSGKANPNSERDPAEAVHCGTPAARSLRAVLKSTSLAPFLWSENKVRIGRMHGEVPIGHRGDEVRLTGRIVVYDNESSRHAAVGLQPKFQFEAWRLGKHQVDAWHAVDRYLVDSRSTTPRRPCQARL